MIPVGTLWLSCQNFTCKSGIGSISSVSVPSARPITVLRVISIPIDIAASATASPDTISRFIELKNVMISNRNEVTGQTAAPGLLGPWLVSEDGMFRSNSYRGVVQGPARGEGPIRKCATT